MKDTSKTEARRATDSLIASSLQAAVDSRAMISTSMRIALESITRIENARSRIAQVEKVCKGCRIQSL